MEFVVLYFFLGSMYFSSKSVKRALDNMRKNNQALDNLLNSKRLLPMLLNALSLILVSVVLTIAYPIDLLLELFDIVTGGKKQ